MSIDVEPATNLVEDPEKKLQSLSEKIEFDLQQLMDDFGNSVNTIRHLIHKRLEQLNDPRQWL